MTEETLGLVDPEQREAVASFPNSDPEHDLAGFRRQVVEGTVRLSPPVEESAEVRFVPSRDGGKSGGVAVRMHAPAGPGDGRGRPAIIYAHGGGMIAGTAGMMDGALARLARQTGCVVTAVDYRLAPEHPFPAALDDCYEALVWLAANAPGMDVDPARILMMGDSGGGTLAAATALLARDRQGPTLAGQVLLYPMLDMRTGSAGHPGDPLTGHYVWTRPQNRFAWSAVRGRSTLTPVQKGYLSPALAPDLADLPPAVVMVGALDLFRPEDVAYASRLAESGVPVDLSVHAGGVHNFDAFPGSLAERARHQLILSIRALLRP